MLWIAGTAVWLAVTAVVLPLVGRGIRAGSALQPTPSARVQAAAPVVVPSPRTETIPQTAR